MALTRGSFCKACACSKEIRAEAPENTLEYSSSISAPASCRSLRSDTKSEADEATSTYFARESFCETGIGFVPALVSAETGVGTSTATPATLTATTNDQNRFFCPIVGIVTITGKQPLRSIEGIS